jgi:hypothetical protein
MHWFLPPHFQITSWCGALAQNNFMLTNATAPKPM